VLIAVVGVFLAIRAYASVQAVLETKGSLQQQSSPLASAEPSLFLRLSAKDERWAASSPRGAGRDPFQAPLTARAEPRATAAQATTAPAAPSVRLLLYDHTNPIAVLSVGSETSERLQQGDRFQGWEVVAIQPGSVTISRNGETLVLTSP
jgi:hypothetical protein